MPLSMMPGMPADGQVRLAVSLSLTNSSSALRALDPATEFVLRDERSGEQWQQVADSFGGLPRLTRGPVAARGGRRNVGVMTTTAGGATMVIDPLASRGATI